MTDLAQAVRGAGIDLVATVPDSWLSDGIEFAERAPDVDLVRVAREDDAIGVCAGAWLGGRRAMVLCQNAGLLLSVNALAGLAHHHQIPALIVAADRGGPGDAFYYQQYKGAVTIPVLDAIGIPWSRVDGPNGWDVLGPARQQAELRRRPVVLLADRPALRIAGEVTS